MDSAALSAELPLGLPPQPASMNSAAPNTANNFNIRMVAPYLVLENARII